MNRKRVNHIMTPLLPMTLSSWDKVKLLSDMLISEFNLDGAYYFSIDEDGNTYWGNLTTNIRSIAIDDPLTFKIVFICINLGDGTFVHFKGHTFMQDLIKNDYEQYIRTQSVQGSNNKMG